MEYSGWNLMDKVSIVLKNTYYGYSWKNPGKEVMQGYLVDPSNKKQMNTAKYWARTSKCLNLEASWENREYETIEGEVIEVDNTGWRLKLYDNAGNSSQGGKLSFWNCIILKDDLEFIIGIHADLLLELLLHSTVINGEVQEELSFARRSGGVGALHKDMPQYKEALADMDKKKVTKRKTSKHRVGYNYFTLTENHVYVGDLYDWLDENVEEKPSKNARFSRYSSGMEKFYTYTLRDKPRVLKMFTNISGDGTYNKKFSSTKQLIEQEIEKIDSAISEDHRWVYSRGVGDIKEKLPARTEGEYCVEIDATPEDWQTLIDKSIEFGVYRTNKQMEEWPKSFNNNEIRMQTVGLSALPDKNPDISQEVIDLIDKSSNGRQKIII